MMTDQANDAQVLRRLLTRRGWLLSYIRLLVRDVNTAEDVFQEVCVTVLRKQGEITAGANLDAYFRKVARHVAFAALEKSGRSPVSIPGDLLETLEETWTKTSVPTDSWQLEALRNCVGRLPPRSRYMLTLRYDEYLTGGDLAEKLGSTVQGAYVALSRVHRALRKCVEDKDLARGSAS